jgi:hypothetical protein
MNWNLKTLSGLIFKPKLVTGVGKLC